MLDLWDPLGSWNLLLDLSSAPSLIGRSQPVLIRLSPRPLLCVFLVFLVFQCSSLSLVLSLLETALARQILFLLLFFPLIPPLWLLLLCPRLSPPPPLILPNFLFLFSFDSFSRSKILSLSFLFERYWPSLLFVMNFYKTL